MAMPFLVGTRSLDRAPVGAGGGSLGGGRFAPAFVAGLPTGCGRTGECSVVVSVPRPRRLAALAVGFVLDCPLPGLPQSRPWLCL